MRSSTEIRLAAILFALVLLSMPVRADFSSKSLTVMININPDGSANVEEQLAIIINGSDSENLYETTRTVYSDITTWQTLTQLPDLRQHISGAKADTTNIRITPEPIGNCNSFLGTCQALILMDYNVLAAQNGSGLVAVDRYKPRTARYTLQQDALSFELTKSGDLTLLEGTQLMITVPQPSEDIYFSTTPSNLNDTDASSFIYNPTTDLRYYAGAGKGALSGRTRRSPTSSSATR